MGDRFKKDYEIGKEEVKDDKVYKIQDIMKKENIGNMFKPIDSPEVFLVKDYSANFVEVVDAITKSRIEDVYTLNYILRAEFERVY